MIEYFKFHEFYIPKHLSVFVGGAPADFGTVSADQLELCQRYIGLSPNHIIFEVGCGPGKAAIPIGKFLSGAGRYLGVDVSGECINRTAS